MHDILARLLVILEGLKLGLRIQRVEQGLISELYMRGLYNDAPLVLIEPNGNEDMKSFWANHRATRFNINLWIMHNNANPNNSRVVDSAVFNQYPTLSQLEESIRQELAKDKNLGGAVTQWDAKWSVQDMNDPDNGIQIRKVSTSWTHQLIPFDGVENNQPDMVRA